MRIPRRAMAWATEGTALVVAGVLYFVDLFLPWTTQPSQVIFPIPRAPFPNVPNLGSASSVITAHSLFQTGGWGGVGTVAGVLVALLVVWEATRVARVEFSLGPGHRSLLSAMLAFGVALFTAINVAGRLTWMQPQVGPLVYGGTFLWISVGLGVAILIGGWLHWVNWLEQAPPPAGALAAVPPEPQASPPGTCFACGHRNTEDARFCSACGAQLRPPGGGRVPHRRGPRGAGTGPGAPPAG
ncbi:MAG: zinc ribbon domain-containing protein [Candidatus Dormibacteria bacterium]